MLLFHFGQLDEGTSRVSDRKTKHAFAMVRACRDLRANHVTPACSSPAAIMCRASGLAVGDRCTYMPVANCPGSAFSQLAASLAVFVRKEITINQKRGSC